MTDQLFISHNRANAKLKLKNMLPYDLNRKYLPDYLPLSSSVNFVLRVIYIRLKYLISGFPAAMHHFKRRNIIFIHIPKNAGSSITQSLFQSGLSHTSALYYKLIDKQSFEEMESFALFRDPVERFCSAFNYIKYHSKQAPNIYFRENHLQQINSISELVAHMQSDLSFKSKLLLFPHFRSQSEFVCDSKGKIIVNQIGHLNHISQFTQAISLHLKEEFGFDHINKSTAEKKINDADTIFIQSLYCKDLIIEKMILESKDKVLRTYT